MFGRRAQALFVNLALLGLGTIRRRHDVSVHARAADGGHQLGGFLELREVAPESCFVFTEFHREAGDGRRNFELLEQRARGFEPFLDYARSGNIHAGKSHSRRQTRKLRPWHAAGHERAVQ